MDKEQIYDLLQDHFDYLDQIVEKKLPNKNWRQRGPIVMGFSTVDRDLYFVWDVVAITCNAGMGAWIHYHIDDIGWIDDAARAFTEIGHPSIGKDIKTARTKYLTHNEDWDDGDLSKPIWDLEDQIAQDLYQHLVNEKFNFQKS